MREGQLWLFQILDLFIDTNVIAILVVVAKRIFIHKLI